MSAKSGELKVTWSKKESDIIIYWGGEGATKNDSWVLWEFLTQVTGVNGKTFRKELEDRGYDLTTLKFSVKKRT